MDSILLEQSEDSHHAPQPARREAYAPAVASDWRSMLPALTSAGVTVRELRMSDAPALHAMLTTAEVLRFISPPPTTVEGFERFIAWTARERAAGRSFTVGIIPEGQEHAVGIIQVRAMDAGFTRAEWGFALGSPFWGRGIFQEGAKMIVEFAVEAIGVHRLEARADVANGRGNGALRTLGAVEEAVLRQSFNRRGDYTDQILWTILDDEWRAARRQPIQAKTVWGASIH